MEASVPFLNVMVSADLVRRMYSTSLYTKPNAAASVPLDPRSGQAWHVHKVWPKSQLGVATQIEGSPVSAAKLMVSKFNLHCIEPPAVAVDAIAGISLPVTKKTPPPPRGKIWVALPYHALHAKALTAALKSVSENPETCSRYLSVFKKNYADVAASMEECRVAS